MEVTLKSIADSIGGLGQQIQGLSQKVDSLEVRMGVLEEKVDDLTDKTDNLHEVVMEMKDQMVTRVELDEILNQRFAASEHRILLHIERVELRLTSRIDRVDLGVATLVDVLQGRGLVSVAEVARAKASL